METQYKCVRRYMCMGSRAGLYVAVIIISLISHVNLGWISWICVQPEAAVSQPGDSEYVRTAVMNVSRSDTTQICVRHSAAMAQVCPCEMCARVINSSPPLPYHSPHLSTMLMSCPFPRLHSFMMSNCTGSIQLIITLL